MIPFIIIKKNNCDKSSQKKEGKIMINNGSGLNQTQLDILSELEYLSGKVSEENISLTKTGTGGYLTLFFDYLKERFELHQIDSIGDDEGEVTKDAFKRKIARFELRSSQEVENVLNNYSLEELAQLPLNKMILKLKGGKDLSDEKENGLWEKIFTLPFSPLKLKDTWTVSTFKTFNLVALIWYRQVSETEPETEWQKIIVDTLLEKKKELRNKVEIVQETECSKMNKLFESLFKICGGKVEGIKFLRSVVPDFNQLFHLRMSYNIGKEIVGQIGLENFTPDEVYTLYSRFLGTIYTNTFEDVVKYLADVQSEFFEAVGLGKALESEIDLTTFAEFYCYYQRNKDYNDDMFFERFFLNNKYLNLEVLFEDGMLVEYFYSALANKLALTLENINNKFFPDHIHFDEELYEKLPKLKEFFNLAIELKLTNLFKN